MKPACTPTPALQFWTRAVFFFLFLFLDQRTYCVHDPHLVTRPQAKDYIPDVGDRDPNRRNKWQLIANCSAALLLESSTSMQHASM
jgi:hypothetical protein